MLLPLLHLSLLATGLATADTHVHYHQHDDRIQSEHEYVKRGGWGPGMPAPSWYGGGGAGGAAGGGRAGAAGAGGRKYPAGYYDYIVVGSGPGGGPVACRLARAGYNVLLMEAGDDSGNNLAATQVPVFQLQATEEVEQEWVSVNELLLWG